MLLIQRIRAERAEAVIMRRAVTAMWALHRDRARPATFILTKRRRPLLEMLVPVLRPQGLAPAR